MSFLSLPCNCWWLYYYILFRMDLGFFASKRPIYLGYLHKCQKIRLSFLMSPENLVFNPASCVFDFCNFARSLYIFIIRIRYKHIEHTKHISEYKHDKFKKWKQKMKNLYKKMTQLANIKKWGKIEFFLCLCHRM